jgi:oxygen-independent coproporphyrinogen-3 oxidase
VHLPFCEALCTYCGCNKKITTNHSVEEVYLQAVLKEWAMYRSILKGTPIIRELHLGGGTPTFFSPENLEYLIRGLLQDCIVHEAHEFSFEGHPNNTSHAHLETLYELGFTRVSFGVQDHDPEVQRIINRIQPVERVQYVTELAREIGYKSVNFDLIYGLPRQTLNSMATTIEQSIALRPDRVAFYSYAHVPWTSKAQRLFDERDLPNAALKLKLYTLGRKLFTDAGYIDIGMDHFALPGDDLCLAYEAGRLHRNFMGYTSQQSGLQIGLGVSAISDAGMAYGQNAKTLHDYYQSIEQGQLALRKGYLLSEEDGALKQYILNIICRGYTQLAPEHWELLEMFSFPVLEELAYDGLIVWDKDFVQVTAEGHHYLRNICSAFDLQLLRSAELKPGFSQAI